MFLPKENDFLTLMVTLAVVILAAGQGTRMKSNKQKIMHEVGGRPMVAHVFEATVEIADRSPVIVVGPGEDGVRSLIGNLAEYVLQPEQLGTGHATMMAKPALDHRSEQVLVAYADMPLLRAETLARLAQAQIENGAAAAMLTVEGHSESSFGRILRDEDGAVVEILEVSEALLRPQAKSLLAIKEQNAGVYCFDAKWLWENISKLSIHEARTGQEYFLTDMISLAVEQNRRVVTLNVDDADECLGAGTRAELVEVEAAFRRRANHRWLDAGVTLIDPGGIYIDQTVTVGQDSVIWPGTYLQGATIIGKECQIGPNTIIRNAQIGDGCRIEQAVVIDSVVEPGSHVEPFTLILDER